MNRFVNKPKVRYWLTFIMTMGLAMGLLSEQGQPLSWAASARHPHFQTVPPRDPTPTEAPSPEPPPPTKPSSDGNNSNEEDDSPQTPPASGQSDQVIVQPINLTNTPEANGLKTPSATPPKIETLTIQSQQQPNDTVTLPPVGDSSNLATGADTSATGPLTGSNVTLEQSTQNSTPTPQAISPLAQQSNPATTPYATPGLWSWAELAVSLGWLLALILGTTLILSGIYLVHRS